MTATVLMRDGMLSRGEHLNGWMGYINNGEYTDEAQQELTEELLDAQVCEFEARLPDGCTWAPYLSEIHGPYDTELPEREDLEQLMETACRAVEDRFGEIEARAISSVTY